MRMTAMAALAAAAFALTACDEKVMQRTAIGGAAGALAGEAIWSKPVEGALVGGAIGAATAIE